MVAAAGDRPSAGASIRDSLRRDKEYRWASSL
jgi:hypothetical protein